MFDPPRLHHLKTNKIGAKRKLRVRMTENVPFPTTEKSAVLWKRDRQKSAFMRTESAAENRTSKRCFQFMETAGVGETFFQSLAKKMKIFIY